MKIILSRKAFDSRHGGHASPILPDWTMLSLPIPRPRFEDELEYSEIRALEARLTIESLRNSMPVPKLEINALTSTLI